MQITAHQKANPNQVKQVYACQNQKNSH